ncbi:UPF0721 transmembrane protein [Lachnospiraceae bacterium]|uniref:sulfite exporter TauE/SafE family protein n=1 Tax=Extibacter sp. GGCC_0201 TaxID=2731209 RepID=UPI001AA0C41A|nr:sulfite exporter TauE/SafE family protein [Extibacter sp. GGCC_0201]MBO1722311.1 sulfite exporter TauE/SafE family protein [Extibacter sp. GGCC_0201]BDF32356.1 UPF0721 transmembrane protein [Lachnospiraceae bacterium]BDF36366.1 UPF0721 transmembrane protein [Lachnospiraceae bacterium]
MNATTILRIIIIVYTAIFAVYWIKDCVAHKEEFTGKKVIPLFIIGAITNFLDTLGIGSFATTQAGFKFTKSSPDETMPGTLNIGDAIPVVTEFVLFLTLIEMDTLTLVLLIISAVIGSYIGAGIVSKMPVKQIRIALGAALIALAIIMGCRLLSFGPFGAVGTATGLTGIKLVIGIVVNFFLGAFMTIGVGLYAPCMAMIGALGMNIQAAFPVMMGSCAFLMPACGIKFIKEGKYDRKASVLLTVGGVIGVLIAYFLVKSMPMTVLTWVVIVVMIYTAITFFRDASKG